MAGGPRSEPLRASRPARSASATAPAGSSAPRTSPAPASAASSGSSAAASRGVASVIPPRYRGVSFDRPPVSDMARDLTTKARSTRCAASSTSSTSNLDAGRGLWLFGDTAPARRRWRCWSPRRRWRPADSVAIYSLPKLLARIRRTYDADPGGTPTSAFFERLTSVDLLHIDDLGAEKRTDWVLEQLYALINERYEDQRSMLVTTNLRRDARSSEEQIGARTVSRLTRSATTAAAVRRATAAAARRARPAP